MLTNYRFQALPLSPPALCDLESVFQSQASSLGHLALISSLLAATLGTTCFYCFICKMG